MPRSLSHRDGGGREGSRLVADAVQPDVCGALLCLHSGRDPRGAAALHPRVVDDVLKGGPVRRPQRQTPLDQLLAFWRTKRDREQTVSQEQANLISI